MPQYIKHFGASDGGTLINDVLFHFSLLCDKTKRKVFLHKCHICPYLDISCDIMSFVSYIQKFNAYLRYYIFDVDTWTCIISKNEFYLVALKFVAINMSRVFILGYANEYGSNITAVQRFVPLFMTIQHMNILMFHNVNFCFPFMYTIGSFYCRSTFLNEKPIVLSGGRYLRKLN